MKRGKSVVREYYEAILVAFILALFVRTFVFENFKIPSGSMIPTLRVGDHIFVNKFSYGVRVPLLPLKLFGRKIPAVAWSWSMPERGDVIVFITPENEEEDYIKRVVAVAGDTLEVNRGVLRINGKECRQSEPVDFVYNDLDEEGRFRVHLDGTGRFRRTRQLPLLYRDQLKIDPRPSPYATEEPKSL